jgi:prepilin-type processing-associated H-X9-DG protein
MAGLEGVKFGIMGCPSVFDGWADTQYRGVVYPAYLFHYESLGLNLDATNLYCDGGQALGRYVPGIDRPTAYMIYGDTIGVEGAYMAPSSDRLSRPDLFTRHSPIPRHSKGFNALYLDGHARKATLEKDWKAEFLLRACRN